MRYIDKPQASPARQLLNDQRAWMRSEELDEKYDNLGSIVNAEGQNESVKKILNDQLRQEPGHQAVSSDKKVKLTPARAMLVYMLDRLQQEGNEATAFSAVKSVYFLQKFGAADIFKMKFERYMYGPYCDQVRHVLHAIDGGYVRGFADMSKRPFEPFDIIPEKMPEVRCMVESDILLNDIVTRTCQFLEGYWDDFSLELMSSVDFLIAEKPDSSVDDVYDRLGAWTARKKKLFADKNKVLKVYNHILN